MDFWFSEQYARLKFLPETKRYLYYRIDWSHQCIGILGARGTGKTTMILQYIKENYGDNSRALYISADHPKFQNISMYDFAKEFYTYGGEIIAFDEVHKYNFFVINKKII